MFSSGLYSYSPAVTVKEGVHFYLYSATIMFNGSAKHEPLVQRAVKLEDIGSFGLTELGHGSNVREIETTATYDNETN